MICIKTDTRVRCNDLTAVGSDSFIDESGLKIKSSPMGNYGYIAFDGDEGTVHAPQSKDSMMELALLMSVKNCIMNSQNNKNIIGVVFDSLTGSYLLTQPETFVSVPTFMNIVSFIENDSGRNTLYQRLERYHVPRTSGRALFSAILPEDFYYNKGDVLIRDGILLSGVLSKDHLGSAHGSIIQVMMKDYGDETTINFLTDIYNIVRQWLDVRGFSVGLDDCFLIGDNPEKSIQYEVERAKMLVKSMGWKLNDPLEEERREKQIIAYLNTAKGLGGRISEQNLAVNNAYNVMAKSGAKGSTFNIAQITGILGQQFVQGQRMPEAITDGTRCLPYFPQNSLDPKARGFCVHSFLEGLSPSELFFHQAGGREGLTDTAIKTAETGSMHHSVVKALEDLKVYNDGSARNAFGVVFQYVYGEDGFDAAMLETVNTKTGRFTSFINTKRLAGRINARYGYKTPGEKEPEQIVPKPAITITMANREMTAREIPTVQELPAPGVQVGEMVNYQGNQGIVQLIEGQRVLIQPERGQPEWVDIGKIE